MKDSLFAGAVLAALSFLIAGPVHAQTPGQSYILMSRGNDLPPGLEQRIHAAGGKITRNMPDVGLVVVEASNPDFAAAAGRFPGINNVMPDVVIQWHEPMERHALDFTPDVANPPFSGSADFFFDLQWGHAAIGATEAWANGIRGQGVRVAVLDGGFDLAHPDLAPNINLAVSASFVPGESLQYALPDPFSHGSHVAGTIAAAQNNFGTIGVAPDAELMLLKVLSDAGSGSFSWLIEGIVHAANNGADVINMSLGANFPKSGFLDADGTWVNANEVAALTTAVSRATSYAYQRGVTVFSSAGNSALDSSRTRDLVAVPSQSAHVISISATAPIGWATDPLNISLDNLASYSNYGVSHIDFAAPGGDLVYPGDEACVIAGLLRPCWVFDLVFSTGNGGWYWSAGTSMASPHAAGVAALVISANGGSMHPAQVESVIRSLAEDLGKPGRDAFYGHGRMVAPQ
jgi:lantibiotic leader peptide-processing serine protease